jgi:hypothetical protein
MPLKLLSDICEIPAVSKMNGISLEHGIDALHF